MIWNKKVTHKQSKYFTIMLIPDSSVKVKSIKIPHWCFYLTGAAVALVILGFILSGTQVNRFKEMFDNSNVKLQETLKQNDELLGEQNKLKTSFQLEKEKLEDEKENVESRIKLFEEKVDEIQKKIDQIDAEKEEIYTKISAIENRIGAPIVASSKTDSQIFVSQEAVAVGKQDKSFDVVTTELMTKLDRDIEELQALNGEADLLKPFLEAYPSIWPVKGKVTSEFGYRGNPFGGSSGEYHEGVDIKVSIGTKVAVTSDGVVSFAGVQNGYGNIVTVDHGYGFSTSYAHNSELLVNVGDTVKRGEVIALSGNTGRSTGPHVHYEVKIDGVLQNPRDYLN